MKMVYADPSLGYSQMEDFNVPADFNSCGTALETDSIVGNQIDDVFE